MTDPANPWTEIVTLARDAAYAGKWPHVQNYLLSLVPRPVQLEPGEPTIEDPERAQIVAQYGERTVRIVDHAIRYTADLHRRHQLDTHPDHQRCAAYAALAALNLATRHGLTPAAQPEVTH